jgi:N-acyl-D-amino-acid deacylase
MNPKAQAVARGQGFVKSSQMPSRSLTRRRFLVRAGSLSILAAGEVSSWTALAADRAKTSVAEAFDREMDRYMTPRHIPGGALAVVKDSGLVYARGYGWADREKREPVKPESLFRIASITKPFTSAAVLKLAEMGRLRLDASAVELVGVKPLANGREPDPLLNRVTVRQCLQHTGGWDRDKSGDPMFRSLEIARAVGVPAPARQEAIIQYMLAQPLDFDPGSRSVYSNFGYCLLGRVIEKVSGAGYEEFVRREILEPMGIKGIRLGASLERNRAKREVKYYTRDGRKGPSVFPEITGTVSAPYGSFCLEAMDSHGGWLASAVDLARFAAVLDKPGSGTALKPETRRQLYEPPAPPVSRRPDGTLDDYYYACGWEVRPIGEQGRANYWHSGSLPGTFTLLVRRFDGQSWVALFNQRSEDPKLPDGAIDSALHRAADAVGEWPAPRDWKEASAGV